MKFKLRYLNMERYETKTLEKYLEAMALEGWILCYLNNSILRFQKGEKTSLKYSIVRSNSDKLWSGVNKNKELKIINTYTAAGWKLITSYYEINVFATENLSAKAPSDKTLKEEISNDISLSQKSIPAKLLIYVLALLFMAMCSDKINLFSNSERIDVLLFILTFITIAILYNIFDLVRFLRFKRDFNRAAKNDTEVDTLLDAKSLQHRINLLTSLMTFFYLFTLYLCIISFIYPLHYMIILGLAGLTKTIRLIDAEITYRTEILKQKKTLPLKLVKCLIILLALTVSSISLFFKPTQNFNAKITLNDFNDTSIKQEYDYPENSIVAQKYYYSEEGENYILIYDFIKVKYDFLVDKYYKDTLYYLTKNTNELYKPYASKELQDLPNGMRGYALFPTNTLILNIKNNIIIVRSVENLSQEEIINVVYEKLK